MRSDERDALLATVKEKKQQLERLIDEAASDKEAMDKIPDETQMKKIDTLFEELSSLHTQLRWPQRIIDREMKPLQGKRDALLQ